MQAFGLGMNRLEERWREREKARCKRRKGAKKASPPCPVEMPEFKFKDIKFAEIVFVGFVQEVKEPRRKGKLEQVIETLHSVRVTIKDLGSYSYMSYDGGAVKAIAKVKPMESTSPFHLDPIKPESDIPLHGSGGFVKDPTEAVRLARQSMIELCTHEIDEWLYHAGLGPNPHNWPTGAVPPEEVGKLSPRFVD